ncbi:MAG: DNA polymerase/3'-5' exonuclease PolX [Patescibacteria group bacterium]|nr:DNA polymerase/3'-5' exonuclease PolX [Patescibacteria group bacterium]
MAKTRTAQELEKIFLEFAYYNDMKGVAFKPRAYELASESMAALGDEIKETWSRGGIKELKKLPGVGQSTAEKIDEYFRTGKIKEYAALKKEFPVDMWGLSRIEGLGPKHIRDLYKYLKVKNLTDLKKALKAHKVQKIPLWGEKSEEKLLRGLGLMEQAAGRKLLGYVLPLADEIVTQISKVKGVKRCTYAGSIRRKQETIGDIDLFATAANSEHVMDAFVNLPQVASMHEKGKTRASVRLNNGMDCDLRVVPDEVFGATLQYFTGDKRHNVLLRQYALSKGYTLSEYGLFKLTKKGTRKRGKLVVCKTEEEIYKHLGMDTPPPELRVGEDELEAAKKHALPNLIPYGSVKGDMQVQTDWTDGNTSIEGMAKAAKELGLSYMAVTDHTKALAFVGGLKDADVIKQGKEIDKLNKKLRGFRILKGTECDILKDGSLDLKNETLAKLEWVGVSIHSSFRLSRADQTRRLLRAIENPNVDCIMHPMCRIIGKREPIDYDMDEIIASAKKHRVALEIDAFPDRSDLRDIHVRAAVRAGVKLVISTDAHHPAHMSFIPLGEAIARRGWASKSDILNTKPVGELLSYLAKK